MFFFLCFFNLHISWENYAVFSSRFNERASSRIRSTLEWHQLAASRYEAVPCELWLSADQTSEIPSRKSNPPCSDENICFDFIIMNEWMNEWLTDWLNVKREWERKNWKKLESWWMNEFRNCFLAQLRFTKASIDYRVNVSLRFSYYTDISKALLSSHRHSLKSIAHLDRLRAAQVLFMNEYESPREERNSSVL